MAFKPASPMKRSAPQAGHFYGTLSGPIPYVPVRFLFASSRGSWRVTSRHLLLTLLCRFTLGQPPWIEAWCDFVLAYEK